MGLNSNGVKLLLRAKARGVDFRRTVMIGRQRFRILPSLLANLLEEYGYDGSQAKTLLERENGYIEPFLRLLGAQTVHTIDASDYEGAELVHDLNIPIPPTWHQQYSVVLDGGSLEHVFNFPVGIKNCMELLEKGGVFLGISPANNFLGHGFYQFSPELFYRVFSERNGFQTEELLLYTDIKHRRNDSTSALYRVADPMQVKRRVELVNSEPSFLFVCARRTQLQVVFGQWPQQSDYEHLKWQGSKGQGFSAGLSGWRKRVRQLLPASWRRYGQKIKYLHRPLGNGRAAVFKQVE